MPRKKQEDTVRVDDGSNDQGGEPVFEVESLENSYQAPAGLSDEDIEIDPTHPGWTRFILDQLTESEQYENNPKSDGLRRLVEKNIGPIVSIESTIHSFPVNGDDHKCRENTSTVTTTVKVLDRRLKNIVVCQASADANAQSCQHPFDKFLTAVAESKAEGRAYRKLLRLVNVVSAEEMGKTDQKVVSNGISDSSIMAIATKCQRLDVNIKEFVLFAIGETKEDTKIRSIRKLTVEKAQEVLERVRSMEKYLDDNNGEMPKTPVDLSYLKGFDPNWTEYFG